MSPRPPDHRLPPIRMSDRGSSSMSNGLSLAEPATADDPAPEPAERLPAGPTETVIRPPTGWQLVNVSRTLAVPRTAVLPRLARRQDPVQADGPRGRLGRPPAAHDDGRVHGLLRPAGRASVRRRAVPAVRVRRPAPLDVLRDRPGDRREQRGRQRAADHQDLLPPPGRPVRRGRGGGRRLRDRVRAAADPDARVRGRPRAGRSCSPRSCSCSSRLGAARVRDAAGRPERQVPRLPVRHPVPGPVLDVRHPDRVHAAAGGRGAACTRC